MIEIPAKALYFPFLLALLAAAVLYAARGAGDLLRAFDRVGRREAAALAAITLAGLWLRASMSGRYGLDSLLWEHLENAWAALSGGRFVNFLHPGGHSALLTLALAPGGGAHTASLLTIALDTLCVPLVFAAAFLLFGSAGPALASAFVFAALPWQVFVSGMGLDVTSSLFWILCSFCCLLAARRTGSPRLLEAALLLAAWSAQVRTENLALLIFFLPALFDGQLRRGVGAPARAMAAAALLPALAFLLSAPAAYGEGSSPDAAGIGSFMSLSHLFSGFGRSVLPHFLSGDKPYPVWLLPALGCGLVYPFLEKKLRQFGVLAACAALWLLVYGSFWSGGEVYRYSVLLHPVLAMAAGCGAWLAFSLLDEFRAAAGLKPFALAAAAAAALWSAYPGGLFRPEPVVFWPSIRDFSVMDGRLVKGDCVLLQELRYGRLANARRRIGPGVKYLTWPRGEDLGGEGCRAVYYFDLREYAHPRPEDLAAYDRDREALFRSYRLRTYALSEPLRVYEVLGGKK